MEEQSCTALLICLLCKGCHCKVEQVHCHYWSEVKRGGYQGLISRTVQLFAPNQPPPAYGPFQEEGSDKLVTAHGCDITAERIFK
jgi:hypothetical protein